MTRRDWWIGVAIVALALLAHAFFPRYEFRPGPGVILIRVDRWTGAAMTIRPDRGF